MTFVNLDFGTDERRQPAKIKTLQNRTVRFCKVLVKITP
jgi:hypothetical protein